MRCQQCGYANPQEHKFCGMCGARLEGSARAVSIDDNDPLELENSIVVSGNRRGSAQIARKEEQREASGNLRSRNLRPGQRKFNAASMQTSKKEFQVHRFSDLVAKEVIPDSFTTILATTDLSTTLQAKLQNIS